MGRRRKTASRSRVGLPRFNRAGLRKRGEGQRDIEWYIARRHAYTRVRVAAYRQLHSCESCVTLSSADITCRVPGRYIRNVE